MASIEASACPKCCTPDSLQLTDQLIAQPIGSFSLAGAQLKFSAQSRPVLTCTACELRLVGTYDPDGRHVMFTFNPAGDEGASAS